MNRKKLVYLAMFVAVMVGAGAAFAEDTTGWSFTLAPYAWLPKMNGDVAVKGHSAPVDLSFSDTLDMVQDIRGALMLHAEAKREALTALADIYAITTRQENDIRAGETDLRMTQYIGELGAAYALPIEAGGLKIEPLCGGRYQMARTRLDIDALGVDVDKDQGWVDPFVGVRMIAPVGEKVSLSLRGDIGGFGIGSDLAWNVVGAAEWAFAAGWSAGLAYRCLDIDYEDDGFVYNVRMDGPALGVSYTF